MTMIRPRSDVVYGICRGLPSVEIQWNDLSRAMWVVILDTGHIIKNKSIYWLIDSKIRLHKYTSIKINSSSEWLNKGISKWMN